ncbi:MAG TPA: hypothetical protein VIA45_14390 [Thermoanaerobaculia bacterium]
MERLVAAGRESEFAAHRAGCASCDALAREMDRFAETVAALRAPAAPRALFESLYAIPTWTVACDGAADLLARASESDLPAADRGRLESHLSRCEACAEAGAVLGVARNLEPPAPTPWLAAKLAAAKPAKPARRSIWNAILSPRGAIAVAYAAAVLVMILGLNPADLARKAGTARLEQTARSGVQVARSTVADRFGALQERAFRSFEALKGRVGGYGRAALSNALALVMRNDTPRRPSRPRNDDGSGAWKLNQTETLTWRADRAPGGES